MLAADRGPGSAGHGREAGVGGKVSRGGEGLRSDLGEEPGCGPDADSGHARQDRLKRVSVDDLLDLDGDLVTLPSQRLELLCEPGEHQRGGVGAGHHDGLLAERGHDLCRPDTTFAGRVLQQPVP